MSGVHNFETQHGTHYLGYKPSAKPIKFKLGDYVDLSAIKVPAVFGHVPTKQPIAWQQLGNDKVGDCVVAGAAHETMLWTRIAQKSMSPFDEKVVLEEYKKASGWNGVYGDDTDTGLDMQAFASHRRTVGIKDANGNLHKVEAYVRVNSIANMIKAAYVFGAVGVGIKFPGSAAEQFDRQKPWDYVRGSSVEGGHYIPFVGRNSKGLPYCVTWGREQAATMDFLDRYADEIVAYISAEYINPTTLKTPELFDMAKLQADLKAVAA